MGLPKFINKFLDSPETTPEQRAKFVVLCAMEVYSEPCWRRWAEKWLSGEDRSKESADAARYATWAEYYATRAAYYAAWAAYYAAWAARYATRAADYATRAARYATRAAERAEEARQTEVEEEAKKWSPEGWEEVFEVWYKERQIDFERLIEKAKS